MHNVEKWTNKARFLKYVLNMHESVNPFSEADLGLLQHPRWSSLR